MHKFSRIKKVLMFALAVSFALARKKNIDRYYGYTLTRFHGFLNWGFQGW